MLATPSVGSLHLVALGTLTGTVVYTTLVAGPLSFRILPKGIFGNLQSKLCPAYFTVSAFLSTAVTYSFALLSPASVTYMHGRGFLSVITRRLEPHAPPAAHGARQLALLICSAAGSGLNLFLVGPLTTLLMRKRQRIEKSPDSSYRAVELRSVSRQFSLAHGASTMINLVSIVATVWHCAYLGDRMAL